MSVDLCARVNFQARRVVQDGVGYVEPVSAHRTQVNNQGQCKRIRAGFVLDPVRGTFGIAISSADRLCYGGFAALGGKVIGALRGVLSGHISIWFSGTDCIPQVAGLARAIDCTQPLPAPAECYESPVPPGKDCIYCAPSDTECTIEQEVDEPPCSAYGAPGGGRRLLPSGATIIPQPKAFDIYGDDQEFLAGHERTGLVKYYLQPSIVVNVDPLWFDLEFPDYCGRCDNWLCVITLNYLGHLAWNLFCTRVRKEPGGFGACCFDNQDGTFTCQTGLTKQVCEDYGGTWRGAGSRCSSVDCSSSPYSYRACCLPSGQCIDVTEEECRAHGGTGNQPSMYCRDVTCPESNPNLEPREVQLSFQEPIGFFNADFTEGHPRCFNLHDQFCFSANTGMDPWGNSPCGFQTPCWENIGGDQLLLKLDTIGIVCDMRWAETSQDGVNKYPHLEPECIQIANAAFGKVGDLLTGLNHADRFADYMSSQLNRWEQLITLDCREAESIWPVEVIPYQTTCAFPADLVIWQISARLFLSGDPANAASDTPPEQEDPYYGDFGKVRVAAVFICTVKLKVRLRPGWESSDCPVQMANDQEHPCDPVFVDPDRYMVISSGGCTRVPLELNWKGIHGPRPWSKGPFGYEKQPGGSTPCCDLVCAIHGLLIPGEVNDTSDPDGLHRYDGDVILHEQDGALHCGCLS